MNDNYMNIDPSKDLYKILNVAPDANAAALKRSSKRLSMKAHPDRKGGNEERFKEIQSAYDILGDPDKRAYYDRIRSEYEFMCHNPDWMQGSSDTGESKKGFFDDIVNKNLRDTIIDSLFLFQREMRMKIPKAVMNDFHSAVEYVYGTWAALQEEEEYDTRKVIFGGMVLPRRDTQKILNSNEFTNNETDENF